MNKRIIYGIVILSALIVAYYFILHPHVIQAYDIWMGFNYPSYGSSKGHSYKLGEEWQNKPSSFLYRQLRLPNSKPRKALALGILSVRKDIRVLPILKNIILKGDPDLNFQASRCLALFGTDAAAPTLMEIVGKYKNMKFNDADKKTWQDGDRFFYALRALAQLKYEPSYPIILNLAKNGTSGQRSDIFNSALYYYDNHIDEILPLYIERLKNCPNKFKGQEIDNLIHLKRSDAIPALKALAEKEPWNKLEAEKAISYLESLKK